MRIVQVSPKYYPHIGGVEKYVKEVSENLVRRDFEVEVFATDPSGKLPAEEVINGVQVRRFRSIAPSEVGYLSNRMLQAMRKVECDIVHAHGYRALPVLLAAAAKNANKAKLIVTPHVGFSKLGRPFYLIYNPLFGRFIFSRADKITVVSQAELQEIPLLRRYRDKIVPSPIGIDPGKIKENSDRDVNSRLLSLLYVGRIEKKKGLDQLIRVMTMLKEMPIRLTIVGEGPYASAILPTLHRMRNIEFKGKVSEPELYQMYASSHVFISLSEFESHSVSLSEAMAFGCVPIVTDVGGNGYIVDKKTGFLVGFPVQVKQVVRLLESLHDHREILEKKSGAAKQTILTRFSLEKSLSQLIQIYQDISNCSWPFPRSDPDKPKVLTG